MTHTPGTPASSTSAPKTFHTPLVTLNDGHLIPQIGLGVLCIDDEGVVPVVESALEAGYRHIDGVAAHDPLTFIYA